MSLFFKRCRSEAPRNRVLRLVIQAMILCSSVGANVSHAQDAPIPRVGALLPGTSEFLPPE